MFSATKLVGLAAAVALFGIVMLALPVNPPQNQQAPSAQVPMHGEVTPFSGSMDMIGVDDMGVRTEFDWGGMATGEQYTARYMNDDPRYSGLNSAYYAVYVIGPELIQLRVYNGRLFTKDGSWQTFGRGYTHPETGLFTMQEYAVGEGPYEGLFALNTIQERSGVDELDMEGVIFEGGLPELPEEPPTEIPAIRGAP
jgi:hypothetical protein